MLGDAPAAFDPLLGLTNHATTAALREVVRDLVKATRPTTKHDHAAGIC
jgi:hypothetical protein